MSGCLCTITNFGSLQYYRHVRLKREIQPKIRDRSTYSYYYLEIMKLYGDEILARGKRSKWIWCKKWRSLSYFKEQGKKGEGRRRRKGRHSGPLPFPVRSLNCSFSVQLCRTASLKLEPKAQTRRRRRRRKEKKRFCRNEEPWKPSIVQQTNNKQGIFQTRSKKEKKRFHEILMRESIVVHGELGKFSSKRKIACIYNSISYS